MTAGAKDKEIKVRPLNKRQREFLDILEMCLGIVTQACKKAKVDRSTHYEWLHNPAIPAYKKRVEEIKEAALDFSESALMKNIKDGREASIMFHLKCKGKERGYIERVQSENVNYNVEHKPSWFDEV